MAVSQACIESEEEHMPGWKQNRFVGRSRGAHASPHPECLASGVVNGKGPTLFCAHLRDAW